MRSPLVVGEVGAGDEATVGDGGEGSSPALGRASGGPAERADAEADGAAGAAPWDDESALGREAAALNAADGEGAIATDAESLAPRSRLSLRSHALVASTARARPVPSTPTKGGVDQTRTGRCLASNREASAETGERIAPEPSRPC